MPVPDDEYTYESDIEIWSCNNCGAYAATKEEVVHYRGCKAGEAKYWEKFYSKEENNG